MKTIAVVAASIFAAAASATNVEMGETSVIWDDAGVPHIFSEDINGLAQGFGYAHGRDHSTLLLRMNAIASGRSAELTDNPLFRYLDRKNWLDRIPIAAVELYDAMDQSSRDYFDAFATGFNLYAEEYPQDFEGLPFAQNMPLNGLDIFRTNLRVLFSFSFSGARSIAELQAETEESWGVNLFRNGTDDVHTQSEDNVYYSWSELHDTMSWTGVPKEMEEMIGSNAWVINGQNGRSSGNAMLNMNPHLPYVGFFRWYEAQLTCEACGIDVYGANLVGVPNLQIAFNDHLGWSHTVNNIQSMSAFELTLVEGNDQQYMYDGEVRDIERQEIEIKALQQDGTFETETVVNEYSVHGQIIARADGRAMAVRLAGYDTEIKRPNAVDQWWEMGKAKNMGEFKDAMRMGQIPMFYTLAASRDGDILHNFNGWVPDYGADNYNKTRDELRVQDGSTSSTLWTDVLEWDALPTLENPESGFLQNVNESPWSATMPVGELNPADWAQYVADMNIVGENRRVQMSFRLMTQNEGIDLETFTELKMETLKEETFHMLDELLAIVDTRVAAAAASGLASSRQLSRAAQGAEVLRNWDRRMDTDSKGGFLFTTLSSLGYGGYVNDFDITDPLNTPNTLANPDAAVAALATAVDVELGQGRELDTCYGEENFLAVGPRPAFEDGIGFGDVNPEGLVACLSQNKCLENGVDSLTSCLVAIPILNPRPACDDYVNVIPAVACVADCEEDDMQCSIACLMDNIVVENPFVPPEQTLPGNGCVDCFRCALYINGQVGGGDSWVATVEFTPEGAVASGSVPHGNASPYSAGAREPYNHINDQWDLFSEKKLRPIIRNRAVLEAGNVEMAKSFEYQKKN